MAKRLLHHVASREITQTTCGKPCNWRLKVTLSANDATCEKCRKITLCYIERIEENQRSCCEMGVSSALRKVDVL